MLVSPAAGVRCYLPFALIRSTRVVRNINFIRMLMGVHFGGAILAAIGRRPGPARRSRAGRAVDAGLALAALGGGTVLFLHSDQVLFYARWTITPGHCVRLIRQYGIVGGLVVGGLACAVLGGMVWFSAPRPETGGGVADGPDRGGGRGPALGRLDLIPRHRRLVLPPLPLPWRGDRCCRRRGASWEISGR